MPKQKTHRGAAKRLKLTASGKIKRSQAYKSHILTKKPTKRTRNLRKAALVFSGEAKVMKKLIPYK
jgi:large subunit ribosomal protein L35